MRGLPNARTAYEDEGVKSFCAPHYSEQVVVSPSEHVL
jgi:hypothetical protein